MFQVREGECQSTRNEDCDCSTPTSRFGRRVFERLYECMLLQKRLDDAALNTEPAAVDDPDLVDARIDALPKILLHDAGDIPRGKWMEIDAIGDRKNYRIVERVAGRIIEFIRRIVIITAAHKKRGQIALPSD